MKTIFNTYVVMESQEQCDRMKQLCLDNGLKIWDANFSFEFSNTKTKVFEYDTKDKDFFCKYQNEQEYKVTETEFINLLKKYKK